jgi:predicted nuclease of predicted toxin-antitoxin system
LRFLIDASSDARHALHWRLLGHDVTRVGTHYPAAMKDVDILAVAHSEQRVLVTDDRDSGELVLRLRQRHAGVIYLRLDTTRFQTRARRVEDVLAQYGDQLDQFLVVSSWAELLRSTTER